MTALRAPIRRMWSGVRAAGGRDLVDVGAVGQLPLRAIQVQHHRAVAREPVFERAQEGGLRRVADRGDVGHRRRRAVALDVARRARDQVERALVALLVRLAPGDQAVLVEHHGGGAVVVGGATGELEAGADVVDHRDVVAQHGVHDGGRIGVVGEHADRVGVGVVDVAVRAETRAAASRSRPRGAVGSTMQPARYSTISSSLIASRARSVSSLVQVEAGEAVGGDRREVGAAALDPQHRSGRVSSIFDDVLPPP